MLTNEDFQRVGRFTKALVGFRLDDDVTLVDLDEPSELVSRHIRPSMAATARRSVTQRAAVSIFEEEAGGIIWWSTLEAEWVNVTLFYERALSRIAVTSGPTSLSTRSSDVQEAADRMGIRLDHEGPA